MTDKVFEEGVDCVAVGEVVLFEHLICQFGTCFKGEALGLNEGVVAVEEDVFDLDEMSELRLHGHCARWSPSKDVEHVKKHTLGILAVMIYETGID